MKIVLKILVVLLFVVVLGGFSRFYYTHYVDSNSFSIVVLPDTQHYAERYPHIFNFQMAWITDSVESENIKAVLTLGDIVQNDDEKEEEWIVADAAYSRLDKIGIPYSVLPGNHDITRFDEGGATRLYNKYFPPSRFNENEWYGGNFDGTNRNNWITFSGGPDDRRVDFIAVSLEYCPPQGAVNWAREIFSKHSDKIGILATHAFLDEKGERPEECKRSHKIGDNAGADMWREIVIPSENVQIILNGHYHVKQGGVYRTQQIADRTVHQMLSNYQDFPNGGNGFLRILTFTVANAKVQVKSYSPYVDEYLIDEASEFSFTIDL